MDPLLIQHDGAAEIPRDEMQIQSLRVTEYSLNNLIVQFPFVIAYRSLKRRLVLYCYRNLLPSTLLLNMLKTELINLSNWMAQSGFI